MAEASATFRPVGFLMAGLYALGESGGQPSLRSSGPGGKGGMMGQALSSSRRWLLVPSKSEFSSIVSVVLTIDTEPDDAWEHHQNPSVANVRELLRLQNILAKHGARATCLITYKVVRNDDAVRTLEGLVEQGGAEIGTHLHPWENPPFMASGKDAEYPSFPHELPLSLFEDKMSTLTSAITERFGAPTSYRAGRWGLAAEHVRVLERLACEVDTSVTPLIDWRSTIGIPKSEQGLGGVDYRFAPQQPYHPSYDNVCAAGDAGLVEIPLTVGFTRRTPRLVRRRYGSLPILAQRVLRKSELLRPVWAVPPEETRSRLLRMVSSLLRDGAQIINMAFHSSELMVGGSPSSRTKEATDAVFERIDAMLGALAASGVCDFTTLTPAGRRFATNKPPLGRSAVSVGS